MSPTSVTNRVSDHAVSSDLPELSGVDVPPGTNMAGGDGAEIGVDLNLLLNVLFRRRWLIAGIVLASLLVAGVTVFSMTPLFTAHTRILIEARNDRITAIESVIPGLTADEASLNSQVELLGSRGLTRTVMERFNLANDPEFNEALRPRGTFDRLLTAAFGGLAGPPAGDAPAASDVRVVDALLQRLDVQVIEGSRIIALSFSSQDPAKAAEVANAFADEYLRDQLEAKFEATTRANAWLDETVSELRNRVATAEQAVEDFRRESGLVESEGVTLTSRETLGLNAELIRVRAVVGETEARLAQVRSLVESLNSVTSAGEVLDSPLIQRLREQEATIQRRLAQMDSEFGPLHPQMQQLQAEAQDLQAKIAQEIDKIVQRLENEVSGARAHERAVSEQLERLKTQVAENNEKQIHLRALEREAEANRNLLATLLVRYKEVGSQNDHDVQQPDARIVSSADVPITPSYPNKKIVLGLTLIGSLFLAGAVALMLELRDRTFRSGDEIERVLGMPSLGLVPKVPALRKVRRQGELDTAFYRAHSAFGESLHTLHWSLSLANSGRPPKTVLITSAQPEEGKTTIALGLASFQAALGRKVLLIDADTRKRGLPEVYGMPEMSGLLNVLIGTDPSEVIVRDNVSGLDIMTAGRSSAASLPLFESAALDTLLRKLGSTYDMIVLDSPPVSAVADACLLAQSVEITVFVVRWASTRREVVEHALKQLRRSGASIAGALLSRVDVEQHAGYLYGDSGKYQGRLAQYYGA